MGKTEGASAPIQRRMPIPTLIKRNTVLLASSQAAVGVSFQLVPAIASLIMLKMTGSLALVGFTTGITGLTRILISYPVRGIADRNGRRHAFLLGLGLLSLGSLLIFYSVLVSDFGLFITGLAIQGLGQGAIQRCV